MTTFTALKWHLPVPKILGAWRLLSSPNPGDELVELLNLEAAELFSELIFGFLPSVVRGIVCQQSKLKLFHDLSFREFRACESRS